MKLTNTWKHIQGGCVAAVAIVVVEWLLHIVFDDYSGGLSGWLAVVWGFFTLGWERAQFYAATEPEKGAEKKLMSPRQYWKTKWLDTIVDLVAGNAPVWLALVAANLI